MTLAHVAGFPLEETLAMSGPALLTLLGAFGATLVLTMICLLLAGPLMKLLGHKMEAMITRLLGVILAALAVQFVVDGIQRSF